MGKVIKRWLSLLTAVALCLSAYGTATLAEDTFPAAEAARLAAQTDNPLINKYATVITDDEKISLPSDVINVLLLGIDDQDKNYTYRTEMAHTDAMLLLSINLAADRSGPMFNLISIPRDTMAYVPAVKGIYKINSAINCGDAVGAGVSRADDDAVVGESQAGFEAVCDTVSWLLGGIGIDYYCAVTMDAMEELGNVIGGVDFNLEMTYTGVDKNNNPKRYYKGLQHLDGAGIVSYIRARHNATVNPGSDQARAGRQRDIMEAIMDKFVADKSLLFTIIKSLTDNQNVKSGFYANLDAAAMAKFMTIGLSLLANAGSLDMDELFGSYSIDGSYINAFGNWKFRFIDQETRIQAIADVFGVQVPKLRYVTSEYADWLYPTGLKAVRYLAVADGIRSFIEENYQYTSAYTAPGETAEAAQGTLALSDKQRSAIDDFDRAYLRTLTGFLIAAEAVDEAALNGTDFDESLTTEVEKAYAELRTCGNALAKLVGYPNGVGKSFKSFDWSTGVYLDEDPLINEIYVNFR